MWFPYAFYIVLEENSSSSSTPVKWNHEGDAAIVQDSSRFVQLLKHYFGAKASFSGFRRKLNRWGFQVVRLRRKDGDIPAKYSISHKHFEKPHVPSSDDFEDSNKVVKKIREGKEKCFFANDDDTRATSPPL